MKISAKCNPNSGGPFFPAISAIPSFIASQTEPQGLFSFHSAANWLGQLSVWTMKKHAKNGLVRTVKVGRWRVQ